MSKKMMLLALSVVSAALFALPAMASAAPVHISATENFTVEPGANLLGELEDENGAKVTCQKGVTGSGSFHNTTTGTVTLEFNECHVIAGFTLGCTTHAAEGGTPVANQIRTTNLEFHLITVEGAPGILITPDTATGAFAHFTCGGGLAKKTVVGNGIIGTITNPGCGAPAQQTATLKFEAGAQTGVQKHTTYTGTTYNLESPAGTKASEAAEGKIKFPVGKSLVCT